MGVIKKKKKKDTLSDWRDASAKPIKRKGSKARTEIPTKKKHIEANLPYKYAKRKKDNKTGKLEDRAAWKARMKKEGKKVIEKKFRIYASKKLT